MPASHIVGVRENRSLICQFIEIGRIDVSKAKRPNRFIALVVGENEENVRFLSSRDL